MMQAKVISVQLINFLGYHVLFQDVDVVWYKHPLSNRLFTDPSYKLNEFDLIFQEDGSHSTRYNPYSANSGFYYVRNNERTRYLFTQLLYHGANIIQSGSHQQILISLLNEYASLYGLSVKILDGDDFPGGFHFHRRKDFMKKVMKGEFIPWIFHMSWTKNKSFKLEYMKQSGYWYVKDQCEDKDVDTIEKFMGEASNFLSTCCSLEPLIQCFYSDRPSIIPCTDSKHLSEPGFTFSKSKGSFW